ncbi:MAG: GTPase [Nanoarchaeota archaeon]
MTVKKTVGCLTMASTNQSPQYQKAASMFLIAGTDKERLHCLEEMIRECPKHKSSEKMLANLKTRYKKLKERSERIKKSGKSGGSKHTIRKEDMQAAIVGFTNTGKSSLLSLLTNVSPEITPYDFTTKIPLVGMMPFSSMQIQMIEVPAINSEYYDRGIVNTADVILVLVTDISQIKEVMSQLDKALGKKLIIFNTKNSTDNRKLEATLKSKKYNFTMLNLKSPGNLENLKERIFHSFDKIRVFTKEPGSKKSERAMILEVKSTIKDIAKKILKNPNMIKETKIWGPSSKFAGQIVGLSHELKDMDTVEFKTR